MTVADKEMYFNYDASGVPVSIVYNGTSYYYVTNLQGDVVGIVNQSGNQLVAYTYDAWGNVLTTTGSSAGSLGKYNPLRYRGYVYDTETKLYYLQSRYYNPEWGRFINADAFAATGQGLLGNNMFAYCNNNPVNYSDPTGNLPWHIIIAALAGGSLGAILSLINGNDALHVVTSALDGALKAGLCAAVPELFFLVLGIDLMEELLDSLYRGLSLEETLAILGLTVATNVGLPESGSAVTDAVVGATFGSGRELVAESGKFVIQEYNENNVNASAVTHGIISVYEIGSIGCIGGMGTTPTCIIYDGGENLWYLR